MRDAANAREVDPRDDLLAWIGHLDSIAGDVSERPPSRLVPIEEALSNAGEIAPDVRLWCCACGQGTFDDADDVLAATADEDGPLLRQGAFLAIEVWTESELSALHALWRLLRLHADDDERAARWRSRLARAHAWHLEHVQPDNATNRPWSLHVSLLTSVGHPAGAAVDDGARAEARHYAETLLHNATAAGLDPLVRWILGDCARELRLATE